MHLFRGIPWPSGALRPLINGTASLSGPRLPATSRYPSEKAHYVPTQDTNAEFDRNQVKFTESQKPPGASDICASTTGSTKAGAIPVPALARKDGIRRPGWRQTEAIRRDTDVASSRPVSARPACRATARCRCDRHTCSRSAGGPGRSGLRG